MTSSISNLKIQTPFSITIYIKQILTYTVEIHNLEHAFHHLGQKHQINRKQTCGDNELLHLLLQPLQSG